MVRIFLNTCGGSSSFLGKRYQYFHRINEQLAAFKRLMVSSHCLKLISPAATLPWYSNTSAFRAVGFLLFVSKDYGLHCPRKSCLSWLHRQRIPGLLRASTPVCCRRYGEFVLVQKAAYLLVAHQFPQWQQGIVCAVQIFL